MSTVLQVVTDETARVPYDMFENLIHRAIRSTLTTEPVGSKTNMKGSARRGFSVVTIGGRNQVSSSGGCSDTSGAIRSNDYFGSFGYWYNYSEPGVMIDPPQSLSQPTCS